MLAFKLLQPARQDCEASLLAAGSVPYGVCCAGRKSWSESESTFVSCLLEHVNFTLSFCHTLSFPLQTLLVWKFFSEKEDNANLNMPLTFGVL